MKQLWQNFISTTYSPEKIYYVVVNILVSATGFLKSFIFMKFLGLYELGILTIIQTVMMSIGLLQFGFLNGGFRIFSIGKNRETEQINNQVFTYIAALSFVLLIVWICILPFEVGIPKYLILVGILIGIISLTCNWLINTLIAKQLFRKLNKLNIISSLVSLLAIPLIYYFKVYGAIIVLLIQPGLFILLCLVQHKELRPTYFIVDKSLIRNILKFGFIPFLTGIFTLLINQVERWSILGWLGTISLGKFYLVFLFTSLYTLVPASLNNLFFPNTMKLYQNNDLDLIKQTVSRYYILLIMYNLIAVILTVSFLDKIITWLLPVHIEGVAYVFWILPGLILLTLSEPIGLLYNASVILKPMFWAYCSSLFVFILLLALFINGKALSLKSFAMLRTITGTYIFFFFILSYIRFRKLIWIRNKGSVQN